MPKDHIAIVQSTNIGDMLILLQVNSHLPLPDGNCTSGSNGINPRPEPPELEADLRLNPGEGFMLLTIYISTNLNLFSSQLTRTSRSNTMVTKQSIISSIILCTHVSSAFFEAICEVHWVSSSFHLIFSFGLQMQPLIRMTGS